MDNLNGEGLGRAEAYYKDYGSRAREFKAAGRKVIGYLSALGPVEVLTAAGVVPLRLKGSVSEAITKGDAYMETIVCPFVRNVFDAAMKGKYDFLDGMVLPHQCDSIDRTNDVWSFNLKLPYWHYLNVPHLADDPSIEFMTEILRLLVKSIESFTGNEITDQSITAAVKAHNENRRLVRELYDLRKHEPPLISGVEMVKVLVSAMSLPVEESIEFIRSVTNEVKGRPAPTQSGAARIMLVGDQIDDVAIMDAVEGTGAQLVMDDLSIGSKMYWNDVDVTEDPLRGIAERYLRKLKIPTTFVGSGENYEEILEERYGHLRDYIKDFNVNGVILLIYKFCDPYGFEVPAMKSFIESLGVPVLYVEDEYSTSTLGRLKTRIEAFLEMIA
jgi:benzoyl-CoA reductase subunit C